MSILGGEGSYYRVLEIREMLAMLLKNLAVALGVEVLGFRTPHPLPFGCPEGMFELPCCHQCRWNSYSYVTPGNS